MNADVRVIWSARRMLPTIAILFLVALSVRIAAQRLSTINTDAKAEEAITRSVLNETKTASIECDTENGSSDTDIETEITQGPEFAGSDQTPPGSANHADTDDALFSEIYTRWTRFTPSRWDTDQLLASAGAESATMVTLSLASMSPEVLNDIRKVEASLEKSRVNLSQAQRRQDKQPSPENQFSVTKHRIRTMSWLLVLGEMLSQQSHTDELRFPVRRALVMLDEGLSLLEQAENDAADPDFDDRLTSGAEEAVLLARLDAIRLRKSKFLQQFSRAIHRTREDAHVLTDVSIACRDFSAVVLRLAQLHQQEQFESVTSLLDELDQRSDRLRSLLEDPENEWLFDQGTPDDWRTALNNLRGPVHVIRAMSLYRAALQQGAAEQQHELLAKALVQAEQGAESAKSRPYSQIVAAYIHAE